TSPALTVESGTPTSRFSPRRPTTSQANSRSERIPARTPAQAPLPVQALADPQPLTPRNEMHTRCQGRNVSMKKTNAAPSRILSAVLIFDRSNEGRDPISAPLDPRSAPTANPGRLLSRGGGESITRRTGSAGRRRRAGNELRHGAVGRHQPSEDRPQRGQGRRRQRGRVEPVEIRGHDHHQRQRQM